jgi:dienelactone hydrolase
MPITIPGFTATDFTHDGTTRTVYRTGSGPAVIIVAELPGITPRVTAFAERVAALGLTAVMPQLFGVPGQPPNPARFARSFVQVCVSREFSLFARGRNSPVTTWLRALARHEHETAGGPGVGVVGMCLTGGFALAMMADDTVLAPVLSQPSLPLALSAAGRSDLGIDDATLNRVKERCAAENLCVLGLRFTNDRLSPSERFARLRDELGDHFVGLEIDSGPANTNGIGGRAHSVLTEDLVDKPGHPSYVALQQVLDLFTSRLHGAGR